MTWKRTKRWIYATIELQQGEKHVKCPHCGNEELNNWTRIIGYLSKIKNWSKGRQEEQKTRVYHSIS